MENNQELVSSIGDLNSKLDSFASALNKASEQVITDQSSDLDHGQIIDMLRQVINQNNKISQGIMEIVQTLKKLQPLPGPLPPRPMVPRPMVAQQQRPMMPQQQRPMFPQGSRQMPQMHPPMPPPQRQHHIPSMNLPPPPPPEMPQPLKKPKKSLSLFGR
tara:strand:+ start:11440 stop:11919 length:480 start_codon:yes stop_codon:yes gene_type:complete